MLSPRHLLLGVAIALAVAACGSGDEGSGADAGPPVPDRAFETFDGAETTLADYVGEPLVVNFWASWCPPCIAEMPEFERVHQARGDEVRFIGLNTQDDLAQAQDLVVQTGVTYDLGLDPDGELFRDFEVVSMPSTFFVNESGAIVHQHAGIMDEAQLQAVIDEHLVGDGSGS